MPPLRTHSSLKICYVDVGCHHTVFAAASLSPDAPPKSRFRVILVALLSVAAAISSWPRLVQHAARNVASPTGELDGNVGTSVDFARSPEFQGTT